MTSTLLPIEKYRELMTIAPICAVDVLFFNEDQTKTLLFKRRNKPLNGIYFSIGGRLIKGESLEECAVRQGLREAGIPINKDGLVFGGMQEEMHPNSVFEGVSYHAIDIFYGYVLTDEKVRLDEQHSEYQWFSVSDEGLHPLLKTKLASLLKAYGKKF